MALNARDTAQICFHDNQYFVIPIESIVCFSKKPDFETTNDAQHPFYLIYIR